jgi:hypothetical protein
MFTFWNFKYGNYMFAINSNTILPAQLGLAIELGLSSVPALRSRLRARSPTWPTWRSPRPSKMPPEPKTAKTNRTTSLGSS